MLVFFLCCDSSQKSTVDNLFIQDPRDARRRQCLYWETSNRKSSEEDKTKTPKNNLLLASSKAYATPMHVRRHLCLHRQPPLCWRSLGPIHVQYRQCTIPTPQRSKASGACHLKTYYIVCICRSFLEYYFPLSASAADLVRVCEEVQRVERRGTTHFPSEIFGSREGRIMGVHSVREHNEYVLAWVSRWSSRYQTWQVMD